MGIGKKIKKKINLVPTLEGPFRRQELLDKINEHGTNLPKSILHEDLDRGFLDFVKNDLQLVVDGKKVPVVDILITTQNWAQFTKTWNFNDLDKNVTPPVITIVRTPEVKYGSTPSLQYTIPNRRQFYYAMVPNWENGRKGMDVYTIPQPVPVDIKFSIKIMCNRMRELNSFNRIVLEKFSSRQAYAQIKGHYIPIIMDDVSDESVMDVEKRKFYMQSYSFTMMGFLIDENEFEVKPAISRALTLMEINPKSRRIKKSKQFPQNTTVVPVNINFPLGVTSHTQTFETSFNLKLDNYVNIDSYQVYINGLFFGQNIFSNNSGKLQVNLNDEITIQVVKTNNNLNSYMQITSVIV